MAVALRVWNIFQPCLKSNLLGSSAVIGQLQVRNKSQRHQRTRIRINHAILRHTDFIKELCVALVKRERLLTTLGRATMLQEYGDMLITMTQRKEPPPDLFMMKHGFFLENHEIKKRLTKRIIDNRRSKRIVRLPRELTEEEFVARLKEEASTILLHDSDAIDKLYGELANRYNGTYGGFVRVTPVPLPEKIPYRKLAFVEYHGNGLQPLPKLPEMQGKEWLRFPRGFQNSIDTNTDIATN